MKTRGKFALMVALIAALGLVSTTPASAQTPDENPPEQVDADIKGTVGLGLIGAELGLLIPGMTGLTDAWSWVVFPTIGAAAGVVTGIFVFEQRDSAKPKAAVATLGVGLGLLIPATVLSLTLANRRISRDDQMTAQQRRQLAAMKAGDGLVRFSPDGTFVRAPGVTPLVRRTSEGVRDRGTLVSLMSGRF